MKIDKPKLLKEKLEDAQIQYLLYEGDGPILIFLHATGFMPWIWHVIARELSDSYRIIVPYFCDHRVAEPEEGLSWMLLAQDLAGLCEKLKIEKPYMVGHSMGGAVATIAAGSFGVTPQKMILIEPIFLPEEIYGIEIGVEDHPLAAKSIKRRNIWRDEVEAREYLKSKALFSSWYEEVLDIYIKHGMLQNKAGELELLCSPKREASLFMGSRHYNPWPIIKNIECPVKVIEGENSDTRVFVDFKKAADTFPEGSFESIKGAGHLVPMEKPDVIVKIIRDF